MKIPVNTISRLSIYLRTLEDLENEGVHTVSSSQLAEFSGLNPAQVRKDLAYFGQFGKRGTGYRVTSLIASLKKVLGIDKKHNMILVGAGNLGSALISYPGFKKKGFIICSVFDNDPLKIGKVIGGLKIKHISTINSFLKKTNVKIAIITTPQTPAQDIANVLVKGGIRAILNFATASLSVPRGISVNNVDVCAELELLSYFVASKKVFLNRSASCG